MFRLFVAIATPTAIQSQITPVIALLRETGAEVRWEVPEKLHLTLKFLGDTREDSVDSLTSTLEDVCRAFPPFTIRYRGLGFFPDEKRPRIIWLGVEDPSGTLVPLASRIDEGMSRFGYEKEKRQFSPHLTIGRVKDSRHINLLLRTAEKVNFQSQSATVQEILLVRSQLQAGGSVYTTLRHSPLAGVIQNRE